MNLQKELFTMSQDDFYKACRKLTKTKGKVLDTLSLLPKSMKVYVYSRHQNAYVNDIYVWEEGHEYRHFIELMTDATYGEPMNVGKLINQLKDCYRKEGKSYSGNVAVNVNNENEDMTANFEMKVKDGSLYFIGKAPIYYYSNLYYKIHEDAS